MCFQSLKRKAEGGRILEDVGKISEICIYTRDLWALYIKHKNTLNERFNMMAKKMNLYTDGEYVINQKDNSFVYAADFIKLYEIKKNKISKKDFELLYLTYQKNTDKMMFFTEGSLMKRCVSDSQIKVIAGENE